jgi:hypothetical protein
MWDGVTERRERGQPVLEDRRGGLWSSGGRRLPNAVENLILAPDLHPARLQIADLENPHGFQERLAAWLMKQH